MGSASLDVAAFPPPPLDFIKMSLVVVWLDQIFQRQSSINKQTNHTIIQMVLFWDSWETVLSNGRSWKAKDLSKMDRLDSRVKARGWGSSVSVANPITPLTGEPSTTRCIRRKLGVGSAVPAWSGEPWR